MVLLGFIDEPKGGKTGDDDDPSNWTISRIGGQPVSVYGICRNNEILNFRHFPVKKSLAD
jgi:hypothetical protein